MEFLGQGFRKL